MAANNPRVYLQTALENLPAFEMPHSRMRPLTLPLLIAALIILPLAVLLARLLTPDWALWEHLWQTALPPMLWNTVVLTAGVGIGTTIIGTGAAWLVTAYDFPARGFFDKAFLLPLALPAFIMGFVFMGIFDYAGPVQYFLRDTFGSSRWFPNIRSWWGVILVMTLVLYPYVYILARAAFREQAASTFEAAQLMGYGRTRTFFRLVLPLARPSIAAGAILAMFEALTDYGTVRFFSYPTLSEGVVRIWEGRMDRDGAIQLAALMVIIALALIFLERALRGQARFYQQGARGRRLPRVPMTGATRWGAFAVCAALIGAAFALPVYQLVLWAAAEIANPTVGMATPQIAMGYIGNSLTLAGVGAAVVIALGVLVSHGVRSAKGGRAARLVTRLITLGYAMPGAVIAVGVLTTLAPIDHAINDATQQAFGQGTGLLFTGTITGLIYAYLVRFMAVGFSSVDSSFEKVTPSMEDAARMLGAKPRRVLMRVHVPLVSTGMAAGAILVFVDIMKELPATLMMRPFGMDTLALWVYFLAAEAFWQAAAVPSLVILIVGLIPVLILMRVGSARES